MAKLKDKVIYSCSECGHQESKWMGRCPSCGAWNTFAEHAVATDTQAVSKKKNLNAARPVRLGDVVTSGASRSSSGISELDRVLGGGIMQGSAILIGGEPGIGKSTLMLQLLSSASITSSLYISGEESPVQIKLRAERLRLSLGQIELLHDTNLEHIEQLLRHKRPQLVIIDSIQTLFSEQLGPVPGSANQIKYTCMELIDWAKQQGSAIFFIGHVTKDGIIAGPKVIEHMVDTVINFEQAATGVRIIRASKNRFGSVDEIGVFTMNDTGLTPVGDPAAFFLGQREEDVPAGSIAAAVFEGSRTFMVEIQALTVASKSGYSRVYSDRIDTARVSRISAVLEKHLGLSFSSCDIYVNVAGGIRLNEVGIELPLALALYSALTGTRLSGNMLAVGELSLAGEVRRVQHMEQRVKTAAEMGFLTMIGPASDTKRPCTHAKKGGMDLILCHTIIDVIEALGHE